MNRYRLFEPRPNIALKGETIFFDYAGYTAKGQVESYSDGKYTIRVGDPPAFHYGIKQVYRSSTELSTKISIFYDINE